MSVAPAVRRMARPAAVFARLPLRRQALLIEAAASVCLMCLAVKVLPFRIIRSFLNRHPNRPAPDGPTRRRGCQDVAWAVTRASARLGRLGTCFPQGMAAQAMLRRRGIATTLYHGVAWLPDELSAHVWLQDGATGIVGHQISRGYRALARYPDD